jgi:hypothetical protein
MPFRLAALAIALTLILGSLARAQDGLPVAVISLVWGEVTVKHQDADYKPARWLEPIWEGDFVKTAGPGSKLLITFFNDNHQEVMPSDSVATVAMTGLTSQSGPKIRVDRPRNPFGAGGVQNPYVYTHNLVQDDFKGADAPGAYEAEEFAMKAWMNSSSPARFSWPNDPNAASYTLQVQGAPGLNFRWTKMTETPQYKMNQDESNAMTKGAVYQWSVLSGTSVVIPQYNFLLLTLPQDKWLKDQADDFADKRKRGQLQRSDYTDYLLVCSQLLRVDNALSLMKEMAAMDPQNPRVFRALTRVYLLKNCPAHAKEAWNTEIQLGGVDPVGL